jgi:hypothetical protein
MLRKMICGISVRETIQIISWVTKQEYVEQGAGVVHRSFEVLGLLVNNDSIWFSEPMQLEKRYI